MNMSSVPEQCTVTGTSGPSRSTSRKGWYARRTASAITSSKLPAGWWLWMPSRNASRSLTIEVPVPHERGISESLEVRAERFDERDGPVAGAGAADRDRQVRLAFPLVERKQEAHEVLEPGHELAALVVRQHELRGRRVASVQRAQALHEMRVRQESHVEHEVGVVRQPVLEAERHQ